MQGESCSEFGSSVCMCVYLGHNEEGMKQYRVIGIPGLVWFHLLKVMDSFHDFDQLTLVSKWEVYAGGLVGLVE